MISSSSSTAVEAIVMDEGEKTFNITINIMKKTLTSPLNNSDERLMLYGRI